MAHPPPPLRQQLLVGLAILHLGCAAIFVGAPHGHVRNFLEVSAVYRASTGLFRDYGYFAPSVASDARAAALLERPGEGSAFVPIGSEHHEVSFRINNLIMGALKEEKLRDTMLRSWAAALIGADARNTSARIVLQSYVVPTMLAYQDGQRPEWRTVYTGRFDRKEEP